MKISSSPLSALRLRKITFRLAALFVLIALGTNVQASIIHVFLVGGQSNADGRASLTGLPANLQVPQADIPSFWAIDGNPAWVPNGSGTLSKLEPGHSRTAGLGPEITFGRSMADSYASATGEQIAIIKFAAGGTNMGNWQPDGTASSASDGVTYQGFQTIVANGMSALQAANPTAPLKIDGMLWMQGETDATGNNRSSQYQGQLTNFIKDIRLTLGIASLPFVIGQLSLNQTDLMGSADATTYFNRVCNAQAAVAAADPNAVRWALTRLPRARITCISTMLASRPWAMPLPHRCRLWFLSRVLQ